MAGLINSPTPYTLTTPGSQVKAKTETDNLAASWLRHAAGIAGDQSQIDFWTDRINTLGVDAAWNQFMNPQNAQAERASRLNRGITLEQASQGLGGGLSGTGERETDYKGGRYMDTAAYVARMGSGAELPSMATSAAAAPATTSTPAPAVSASQSQPATTTVPAPAATAPAITTTAPSTQAAPTETANLSQWNVTEDQTIEGRLNRLLNQDSEYLQRARTSAMQTANRRGLLNSDLAATAGEEAAIGAALPIASADANTYASSAQANTAAANQNAQFNATTRNAANQFNADWANKNYQQATAIAADLQKSQLDQANKVELANIEANYKTLMQTSSSASQVYAQSVSAITNILQDPNMDAASKTTAYNVIMNNMRTQMNMLGSINGVDLTDLLDFQTAE